jgi:diaminohydroxyphosphoribosylaminopyrimidine deaminase/5-amino-6-(5-phosphoribosylamino)uracil reductase
VTAGVLEKECCVMNEAFLKFVTSKRPFVRVKSAMTLDGWTATSTGHSKWITNEYSRQFVHGLRNRADAVMVGVGTVVADDPRLTTRVRRGKGRDPMRIVLDTHLRTPRNARILHHGSCSDTVLVVGPDVKSGDLKTLEKRGVSTLICPTRFGRIDLRALMGILGRMSVTDLLVEGGATLIGSMIHERLVDKFYIFKAPKILGGDDGVAMAAGPGSKMMDKCLSLKNIRVRRFEEDILIEGYPDYGC